MRDIIIFSCCLTQIFDIKKNPNYLVNRSLCTLISIQTDHGYLTLELLCVFIWHKDFLDWPYFFLTPPLKFIKLWWKVYNILYSLVNFVYVTFKGKYSWVETDPKCPPSPNPLTPFYFQRCNNKRKIPWKLKVSDFFLIVLEQRKKTKINT